MHKSATSIFGGISDFQPLLSFYPIVAAVTTIALSLILFCKVWEIRNDSRIPRQGRPARDEHSPDTSTPTQASTIPRPLPADHSPGEEGNLGILVPTQAQKMESAQHNAPDVSIAPLTVNHSSIEARKEDEHDIPIPMEMPFITHPSIDCGHGDAQNAKAGNGVDPNFPVSTEAPTVAIELYSEVLKDGDAGSEEVPSITFFQGSSNFNISNTNINAIGGNATIIRFGDGQFTEIQRNLICDYIANLTVLPDINNDLKKHVLTQSIISLPRAEAVFNDYQTKKKSGPCFEGTRVALLREMADWVTVPDESRMYVLSGLAGIGKSTVAYTIASRAADLNLLGASFFFSRSEADRNNAKRFFTTIAYQLCVHSETFAKAIGDVLKTEHGSAATTKDPQDQLRALILDPLRSIVQSRSRPILIVVDALDECDEEDASSVLTGLSQLVWDLPSFKVILTTRPQPYLDHFLGNQGDHKIFHLQDIEDKVVDGDIRVYLNHSLSTDQVQKRYPKRQWYARDDEIDSLVHAAGRLFIIASTAVRYILDKTASNPAAQMQKLLRATAQDHMPLKDLDHFYTVILRNVVPENCDDDDIVSRYQTVVGAIIFGQHPLSVSTLAHLIGIEVEEIRAVLDNLHSVILLGDDDVPRIYHKSFPDYLTDQARCKDPRLRIDPRIGHARIVTRCFEIMGKYLKYNILGLGKLARFMSNEDGLQKDGVTDEQLQAKIPQQLRYTCVYWANHLEVATIDNADLRNGLAKFVDVCMLYWFEVLSLIGKLDSAHLAIRVVLKLLKSSSDLYQLLSDALRFISKFHEIIKQSALHTYHSALLFTPRDTPFYCRYMKEEVHKICDIEGGPENWDALVANLSHEEHVGTIQFSLNGDLFVSWSEDDPVDIQGKLKIWDAATGMLISTVTGHRFAVANDFSMVASSEDKTITFYDVKGSARGTVLTTSSTIQELALSCESSRVAAALSDGSVWLWDSRNAEFIDSFDGFKGNKNWFQAQLKFSITGTRLAYSSANGIVKVRDGISGIFITDLQCGSRHDLEFSSDGSRIASLSRACGLTLWNSDSGALIGAVEDIGDIRLDLRVLAISANGSLLATANRDKVKLWSGNNDSLTQFEVLDKLDQPGSMAFSLDNILAIATDLDIKLYNVKTHSFISTLPFGGDPTTLAFSPDYAHLAVGTHDGGVYLWDIRGINDSNPPSIREVTAVVALALSRDCSRLACGFEAGKVELWDTSPAKRRIASHQVHKMWVETLGFSPDGGFFASGSDDGTINLWNSGDGSLRETLRAPSGSWAVALSNNVLVAAGHSDVTLWSLDTLSLIHTFKQLGDVVSIAENSTLIAVAVVEDNEDSEDSVDSEDSGDSEDSKESEDDLSGNSVTLLDVVNCTTIATFNVTHEIHTMTFIPDNSQLVAQTRGGVILSLNLINKNVIEAPTLEHLIQLPDLPLWYDVPMWHCRDKEQHYFSALFPQHENPVPVLWIPRDLPVTAWTQGSSMIALGCGDGRIILLRLPTSQVG